MSQTKTCTHIKVSGVRCQGPALRGEQFCYFHQQAHRSVRRPPYSRLHPIAIIEDEDAIQASLMEVINGLVRNTLDVKRASLILRALHIAVKNASRVRLDSRVNQKVREIPEYATPAEESLDPIPNEAGRAVLDEEAELPAVAAKEPKPIDPQDPNWLERLEEGGRVIARRTAIRISKEGKAVSATQGHEATANVGAEAFLRPAAAKQGVPAAEATKNAVVSSTAETARLTPSRGRTNASIPTQTQNRKQPMSVNPDAMNSPAKERRTLRT